MKRVAFFAGDKQFKKLKGLSAATRVKMADYIREGIDLILAKYRKDVVKAKKKQ
jgi:hypothetical protein